MSQAGIAATVLRSATIPSEFLPYSIQSGPRSPATFLILLLLEVGFLINLRSPTARSSTANSSSLIS